MYCVPYAVHLITGLAPSKVNDLFVAELGETPRGVYLPLALKILTENGFGYRSMNIRPKETLNSWVRLYADAKKVYIAEVPGHCVSIIEGFIRDNNIKDAMVIYPHNYNLTQCYEIFPIPVPTDAERVAEILER